MFGNMNSPGMGIDKNGPEKRGFFLFFELFFRKAWQYCLLSIMHCACLALFFYGSVLLYVTMKQPDLKFVYLFDFIAQPNIVWGVVAIPFLLGFSVFTPGFSLVLRNYSWEKHAWLARDYFKAVKNNLKQSLILFAVNTALFYIISTASVFYIQMTMATGNQIYMAMSIAVLAIGVLCAVIEMYVYVIMITFEMKFRDIIKNATLLAFAKLPVNLLLVVCAAFVLYYILIIPAGFGIVVLAGIGYSFTGLMLNFYPSRVVKEHMIIEENKLKVESIFNDK